MKISHLSAVQIVTEISGIINQHINLMDEEGYIIASTDCERIGTFHEAAAHILKEGLVELVVHSDEEYIGSKEGINLPIMFEGTCVGVIGMTGEREEVEKYGQIIKKMTEILILDRYVKEQKLLDNRLKKRFVEEWIFAEKGAINKELVERGTMLEVDITLPRCTLIATVVNEKSMIDNEEHLLNQVEKCIKEMIKEEDSTNIFIRIGSKMIALVRKREHKALGSLAGLIKKKIEEEYSIKLAIGLDHSLTKYQLIHNSYMNAEKALKACMISRDYEVKFYDDINIELFTNEVPNYLKHEFIRKVFKNCTLEEIEKYIGVLEVFFEMNGSIGKASEKLFMHKNTLQYKLKKIYEKTNYDPRELKHAAIFYMAIYFFYEIKEELN